MANIPFQTDLKIELPENTQEKATLTLSETGDLQLVEGKEKLVEQLIRAVVNDETVVKELINKTGASTRKVNALFNLVMRNFKQTQINDTNKSDSDFSGFAFYRKAADLDEAYAKVSADPITWKYIDTGLTNGTEYNYGITKIYNNVFETAYTDKITITPSAFSHRQEIIVGNSTIAIAGNQQIVFYVDYNRKFKASELLNKILSINAQQDATEPRRWTVHIIIEDLLGNEVSLAARRMNPVTGEAV